MSTPVNPVPNGTPQFQEPAPQDIQTKPSSGPFSGKRKIIIIVFLIIICAVGGIFFFRQKISHTGSVSPTPIADVFLATVGDQKIYKSMVVKTAEEQYLPSAINNTILKRFFDVVIERVILDQEAKKLNITATNQEIVNRANGSKSLSAYNITKYAILKEKIMQTNVKSVSAYVIDYWTPSLQYRQKPEYAQERISGKNAMDEAENALKNQQDPFTVTQTIYNKYSDLKNILALNGYIFGKTSNKLLLSQPRLYVFNPANIGKPYYNKELYDTLASMQPNEVRKLMQQDNSLGSVIKVVSINRGNFQTYDEFLKVRKSQLVKTIHTL